MMTLLFDLNINGSKSLAMLFYEMSIVNFIFNEPEQTLPKPLHEFTDDELSTIVTIFGSSLENMLVKAADPKGTRFKNKVYPWETCISQDLCFKKLLDPNDPAIYMPMFEVRYTSYYAMRYKQLHIRVLTN